jgi:NAD(P)H-dependent flavin oxidoreductase YrpB (nitropropane dioxygenase family)
MRNRITELLGIQYPIVAFSHSAQVTAAVSRAGGLGVFGAGTVAAEKIEEQLAWIDAHCDGKPYGVDLILPLQYAGAEQGGIDEGSLDAAIPAGHRQFVDDLLHRHAVPELPEGADRVGKWNMIGSTAKGAEPLIDACLSQPIRLIASALGPPPAALVERAHEAGAVVAALAGTDAHARDHVAAGADVIVAQGTEAGGHTGQIATMVLVPDVVDAVAPTPVLAAGGIASGRQMAAAMALGADGVWCGSVWLTTQEAETPEAVKEKFRRASARDTVRSRSLTGKAARQLRSAWTDAWDAPDAPQPLPIPLQSHLIAEPQCRIDQGAAAGHSGSVELTNGFVGQVVGRLEGAPFVEEVMHSMIDEYERTVAALTHEAVR